MHSATAAAAAPRQWFDCQHGGDKSRIQIQRAMDKREVEDQLADIREAEEEAKAEAKAEEEAERARLQRALVLREAVNGLWDSGFGLYPV